MTFRKMSSRLAVAAVVTIALVLAACSSDEAGQGSTATSESAPTSTEPLATTEPPITTELPSTTTEPDPTTTATSPTTTVAGIETLDVRQLVTALASDEFNGRDNMTPGSLAAQELLESQLAQFAEPAVPSGDGNPGFAQQFDAGTNIIAIVPGTDLADEYVLIGAHYDHLGNDCRDVGPEDDICNGATDNATGVAEAIAIARSIAADGPPRRSLVVALWDAEEDGLLGSSWYALNPVVPLAQTVAYVNFDGQGSNLLPSLANSTLLVGAETGGPNLIESAKGAVDSSALDTVTLSLPFGQDRSDHAALSGAGVPVVFFTDATAGCYHTVRDDVDAVDFDKLDLQIGTATKLITGLLMTETPPVFDSTAPQSTYEDAIQMLMLVTAAQPDFGLLGPDAEDLAEQYLSDLEAIVDAGPDAFDGAANGILLVGAVGLVSALAAGSCDAYIP